MRLLKSFLSFHFFFSKFRLHKLAMPKNVLKPLLYSYLFTWLFVVCFYIITIYSRVSGFSKIVASLFSFLSSKNGLILIHSLWIFFFLFTIITRYFIRVYRKKGFKKCLTQVFLRLILPIFVLVYGIKFIIDFNNTEDFDYKWNSAIENTTQLSKKRFLQDDKIRGMSVYDFGRRRGNTNKKIDALITSNIEWVAVLPYFYQESEKAPKMRTPDSVGIWSRRDSLLIKDIQELHKKELFVMLKPHLWLGSGWRSNIHFDDKTDWDSWFLAYQKNILHYAKMAQKTNVDLFCIGTELRSSLKQKPQLWLALLKEIKSVYKGKLTYAANWDDSFEFTAFWNELDYIGIQAYYPLTKNKNPSLEDIKQGWDVHLKQLATISKNLNKKILFTEIGYRSDVSATVEPWAWGSFFERLYTKKSDKTQLLAYQALYEKLWDKDWFAGTFPWEWNSSDFPIYKKPAQNMIAIWYGK